MADAPVVAVLARLDSSRLPGKALVDVAGRPLLARVVARASRIAGAEAVVVATSTRDVDDPIAAWAIATGVQLFRGAADDVLGRCAALARDAGAATLVRISGDSPFLDPGVGRAVLDRHAAGDADLTTTLFPRTYPPGVSVEAIDRDLLDRLDATVVDAADREHVTSWCYSHPDEVRIVNVAVDPPLTGVHLTVDTPADLARAVWIASALGDAADDAGLGTVLELARRWDSQQPD